MWNELKSIARNRSRSVLKRWQRYRRAIDTQTKKGELFGMRDSGNKTRDTESSFVQCAATNAHIYRNLLSYRRSFFTACSSFFVFVFIRARSCTVHTPTLVRVGASSCLYCTQLSYCFDEFVRIVWLYLWILAGMFLANGVGREF